MAGAGVVRRGAAFQRWGLQAFHHQQPEPWVQGMQKRCQGGTHDPGTHQHSVVSIHSTESPFTKRMDQPRRAHAYAG